MCSMNSTSSPTSRPSRLTRSTTDKKIGGVSGGLATYFDVDPLLVRLGFVVTTLFSGAGLLAYIAMLAFVPSDDAPEAATPAPA
jgi:phage shock protein PspC (stress-responsive transcriptional regulator)